MTAPPAQSLPIKLISVEESSMHGGVKVTERIFEVPLDYNKPEDGRKIHIFMRELVRKSISNPETPCLLYFQGGPGMPSPRPSNPVGAWTKTALNDFRICLLDQRGTGRSSPASLDVLETLGSPEAIAEHLSHFRADNIVRDAEAIRQFLFPKNKWTLLGQSFGGFCNLSYLSFFPKSLERVLFTCGLAPVLRGIDEVYTATYRRMKVRSARYYARYPNDVAKVRAIVQHLAENEGVRLQGGGLLTPERFQQLGMLLGSYSGMEELHWLIEDPWVKGPCAGYTTDRRLSTEFLKAVEDITGVFEKRPLYFLLHESIYCDGPMRSPSNWAAERVRQQSEFASAFDARSCVANGTPVPFTGETVHEWMIQGYKRLGGNVGEAAKLLAKKTDWPHLYDIDKLRNGACSVATAALISYDDVFVEREFSEETASLLGPPGACATWVSNEFQHSALRDEADRVFGNLLAMTSEIPWDRVIPS
uniref:AB hydrolase-1 domain-containing protein n=1 Tax=Chromera velia CCMP2878 TaxID=1169474 RepID=A0A0G4GPA8_9ALVE|eukprot:Cvel_22782.t1-p1 / transcript=Cvel_22782.t1 / gene=Cvel_22782 / organism=Chromera_velia_CCMP2878 / gene_product=Proline iminopeptidase, putative / transcript_product=Proline iminopeptidase, putative / location=Cvel_scaffold2278:11566-14893(-) / protein_length=475 / sequence_SO=supercontig / SO=protein_coding / is_pseudo=false